MKSQLDDDKLQALFRSVVVQANDVVLVTEAEPIDAAAGGPRVVYVNPAFTRMTGYSFDEIVGLTPRILQSPRTDRGQLAKIRKALALWEPVEVELLNIRKDGSEFWVQISISPAADERGWFTHWIAIQREITERKQRDLVAQAMLEGSSDLMLLLDQQGHITAASPGSTEVLGQTAEELIGLLVIDLVHPDNAEEVHALLFPEHAFRLSGDLQSDIRMLRTDGSWLWMRLSAADLPHNPSGTLLLACIDVSERRRSDDALRELNERFRSAFVDAPVGMALTLPSGRVVQANAALAELLGKSVAELSGMTVQDLQPLGTVSWPESLSNRSTSAGNVEKHRQESQLVQADGSVIDVLHSSSAVIGGEGGSPHLIDHFEDITERKSFENQLRHQALHDPLTGLPNRALLSDRIDQALAAAQDKEHGVAVLFVDLDRFKSVNDAVGHTAGDGVLKSVATRLQSAVGAGDTVARLGGDEFVVLCPNSTVEQAASTADRIQSALLDPIGFGSTVFSLTASIGVVLSHRYVSTAATLLRDADTAMYEAKAQGRMRIEIFDEILGARLRGRLQIESELRLAIPAGQLRLHYQPIFELDGRRLAGVEALVRWQHPRHGLLGPGEFITLAEESDLILELGRWVLQEAIEAAARARENNAEAPVMWVNLSAHQLRDSAFVKTIENLLAAADLPASALGLEITESVLAQDFHVTRTVLERIRSLGISLSIDDFGTGYSSLSYLAHFPVDAVKIDRSFVAGLDHDDTRRESYAIINAVVGLARALNLDVIAEGIETVTQANALQGLGCHYGQGFLLGRPAAEER